VAHREWQAEASNQLFFAPHPVKMIRNNDLVPKTVKRLIQNWVNRWRRRPSRAKQVMLHAQLAMTASLTIKAIKGLLRREGYAQIDDHPTPFHEAQEFVVRIGLLDRPDWHHVLGIEPIGRTIRDQAKEAAAHGISRQYFRARRFTSSGPEPGANFGPPPLPQACGRYNEFGNRVLYLSRTCKTASAECLPTSEEPRVFVQQFDVCLPSVRVLRLNQSLETNQPDLHYLLMNSEYRSSEYYRATHFLAFLAAELEISGIEYSSLSGRAGKVNVEDAVNLVVFNSAIQDAVGDPVGDPVEVERFDARPVP
jgi:RES domain-containing protein